MANATTATAAADAPTVARKDAPNACECSYFWTGDVNEIPENGDLEITNEERTGCPGVETRRTFAPGHDAKLKSFLIRAGAEGQDVNDGRGTSADALTVARRYGFYTQVLKGIQRVQDKAKAKADREAKRAAEKAAKPAKAPKAPKAEKPAKPATAPKAEAKKTGEAKVAAAPAEEAKIYTIKVGRWEYQATIDEQGTAHYTNKKDLPLEAAKGTYTLVNVK